MTSLLLLELVEPSVLNMVPFALAEKMNPTESKAMRPTPSLLSWVLSPSKPVAGGTPRVGSLIELTLLS